MILTVGVGQVLDDLGGVELFVSGQLPEGATVSGPVDGRRR